ncbi:hypothetical protein ELD05_07865 [Caldicellulosiruptor changbaiensis]|uniref:Uncharacterized protein n=1 Tax=Caldicellulosiruptor changbaiensis TaxID=1222016 RepID=A0A3T0D6B7_9FIRM|nr:hypothetical protein [Caldicellulosiruptor changbaiensis]AZT90568.1 hypothetical protein ELD05_07865 [Caldicellulosiruptor changbaiensis]
MEKYSFYSYKEFFKKPIRNKIDILKILINTLEIILNQSSCDIKNANITVVKDRKMQRVFYHYENKIFTIYFPFSIEEIEGIYELWWDEIRIDHAIISTMMSIIEIEEDLKNKEFFEVIIENIEAKRDELIQDGIALKIIENSIKILKYLLITEDGYLRYDCDEVNWKKAWEKGNANKHPLHHLDIFYLDDNTFKIGLENTKKPCLNMLTCLNMLIDILNIDTDAYFLNIKHQW